MNTQKPWDTLTSSLVSKSQFIYRDFILEASNKRGLASFKPLARRRGSNSHSQIESENHATKAIIESMRSKMEDLELRNAELE